MAADLSAVSYFAPILTFLIVFVVAFAIFEKTKILGENKWLSLFISFIIATIFIAAAGARTYVTTIVPWFAVLIITLTFILAVTGFVGKDMDFMKKGIGVAFVVILGIVFLISAFFVFSHIIAGFLPGPGYGFGVDPKTMYFLDWFYSPRVLGAVLLIIVSAIASWILVKAK